MVRLRCIVEIEGLLTLVTQGIQQANRGDAQVGTGKGPKRCFDLLFHAGLSLIGQICLIRPIFTNPSLLYSQGSWNIPEIVFRRFYRSSPYAIPWAFRTVGKEGNLTHQSDQTDI